MFWDKEKILYVKTNKTPKIHCRIQKEDDKYKTIKSKDGKNRTLWDDKDKFPFKLDNDVIFTIGTNFRKFSFVIREGYVYNGADIPKFIWSLVGSKSQPEYLVASLAHDYMIEYTDVIYNVILNKKMNIKEYRRLTTLVFRELLKEYDTKTIKANIMAFCVQTWQCTGARKQWDVYEE